MEVLTILKAISNESRIQILYWLKNPREHFAAHTQEGVDLEEVGVCVSQITKKLNMTQSTASHYLATLQRAGLLHATRIGKWTYYRRNEDVIKELGAYMTHEL